MKLFRTIFVALFFISCNNPAETSIADAVQIPSQEKELKEAIAKHPDSFALRETLIDYYQANDNLDLAVAEINKSLDKDSTNVKLLDKKALLLIEMDDTANAIKCYEKAIDVFPDPQYVMTLGWLYAQTKNRHALDMADALLIGKNAKADKEAYLIKGLYFSVTGEKEKALLFFDKSLALDYTFMQGYREKAITLYNIGKYEDAIKVLTRAVTIQNNYAEGYYWLGQCYEKLQNSNAAIESYRKTLLYDAEYLDAKEALAKLGIK